MTCIAILVAAALVGRADVPPDTVLHREAGAVPRQGKPSVTRAKTARWSEGKGSSAEAYALLGDAAVADGRLGDALDAYLRSSHLRGDSDRATLKRVATVQEWTRGFGPARETLDKTLRLDPADGEAREMRDGIALRRSLHLFGSAGGWEVDYARNVQELGAFVGWVDRMDLYGGVSRTDRVFYRRTTLWSDAYLFPGGSFTLRAGVRIKRYEYPREINPRPDNSSYRRSTHLQIEGNYDYGEGNSVSLECEYFRPELFWNPDLRAHNVKLGASLRNAVVGPVYVKIFAAILRDPDPDSFVMDAATGTAVSFRYETVNLLGAALGYDDGALAGEVKYIPDRDLDRSLDWSIFARVRYMPGRFGVQADLLLDRYPAAVPRDVSTSRVVMLTLVTEPWEALEVRGGLKSLTRGTTEMSPFVAVRVKTGL